MATTTAAAPRPLSQKEADIQMMLAAEVHLGTKNIDFQMERYVFKRRNDGMLFLSLSLSLRFYLLFMVVVIKIYFCKMKIHLNEPGYQFLKAMNEMRNFTYQLSDYLAYHL